MGRRSEMEIIPTGVWKRVSSVSSHDIITKTGEIKFHKYINIRIFFRQPPALKGWLVGNWSSTERLAHFGSSWEWLNNLFTGAHFQPNNR